MLKEKKRIRKKTVKVSYKPKKKRAKVKKRVDSQKKESERVIQKKKKKRYNQKTVSKKKKKSSVKKQKKKNQKKQLKIIGLEIAGSILVTGILLWLVSFFTFAIIKVEGYSMLPNVDENERLLVNKLKEPKRFQLAYIRTPDGKSNTIRRIIGLPGEKISYKNDQLWINGEQKIEKFIESEKTSLGNEQPKYTEDFELHKITGEDTIPKEKYFVLGDNRFYAADSRKYGLVDKKDIIGMVTTRLLPFHKVGNLNE